MSCNSEQNLLKRNDFGQNMMCHLPASILTAKFVADKVMSEETWALLGDLRRPHSRLLATYSDMSKCLHIFDETNMTWLASDEFPVKKQ